MSILIYIFHEMDFKAGSQNQDRDADGGAGARKMTQKTGEGGLISLVGKEHQKV